MKGKTYSQIVIIGKGKKKRVVLRTRGKKGWKGMRRKGGCSKGKKRGVCKGLKYYIKMKNGP